MRNIYLDYCATTPVRREVLQAMIPFLKDHFGNPSSIHAPGRAAREAIEESRERVAHLIGARPSEILFTSGGTEANNLAVQGTAHALEGKGNHIVTSVIEHPSVLNVCRGLEIRGFSVTYLSVDRWGLVDPDHVSNALTKKTVLISIMHGNNEIGTIEPIKEIQRIAAEKGIIFHTDAVQTAGKIPLDVKGLAVDLMSLSAHKICGPKGIGALYIREGIELSPLLFGGHQERGVRSGTENVASIVGFGKACELAEKGLKIEQERMTKLRDLLQERILTGCRNCIVNGHPEKRLNHVLSVSVTGLEGESMVREMDNKGFFISSGSACTSHSVEISHVINALGLPREQARGTVRFSLGLRNTRKQIELSAKVFLAVVEHLRTLSELEESLGSRKCF
jgi:cysteine desulfurase